MPKPDLSPEELLKVEFGYISQTAFQANEDRARVSSFYLVAVGSLVAALFSTQLFNEKFDPQFVAITFSGLFFILTILGTLTTLQLARLRTAWYESALAMNRIIEYWIEHAKEKDLQDAFLWNTSSLPKIYKTNSLSFYQMSEVALLSGMTFGASVYFLQKSIGYNCPACNWAFAIAFGLLAFIVQLIIYKRNLEK